MAVLLLTPACVTSPEEQVSYVPKEPEALLEQLEEPLPLLEEPFIASEEVFVETFYRVGQVIGELNTLIMNREFERWLEYLSDEYRHFYNDSEQLAALSESRRLSSAGITLESIEDFFLHVVVPSRVNLRLDDLVFRSETEVEAIMIIQGQRLSVYRLQFIQGQWKITR